MVSLVFLYIYLSFTHIIFTVFFRYFSKCVSDELSNGNLLIVEDCTQPLLLEVVLNLCEAKFYGVPHGPVRRIHDPVVANLIQFVPDMVGTVNRELVK